MRIRTKLYRNARKSFKRAYRRFSATHRSDILIHKNTAAKDAVHSSQDVVGRGQSRDVDNGGGSPVDMVDIHGNPRRDKKGWQGLAEPRPRCRAPKRWLGRFVRPLCRGLFDFSRVFPGPFQSVFALLLFLILRARRVGQGPEFP